MYHFYVQGERDGKWGTSACHYESMSEQTNTFRSRNKCHGKLTGVIFVFHQCCNNEQYPHGYNFQVILLICAVQRDHTYIYIYIYIYVYIYIYQCLDIEVGWMEKLAHAI